MKTSDSKEDVVRLGLLAPLSGLVEMYGQELCWAAQIEVDAINQRGGILGKKIELVIADDGSLPNTAVPAARKLIQEDGCTAIIGNLLSNSRIAVAHQVSLPFRTPYLNFSFYEGSIYTPYFFHFAALPNQQIDKMIPYMIRHFGSKIFFAGSNYEWPLGSIDAGIHALELCGGEKVGEEYFPIGEMDLDELFNSLKRSGADVFVPYFAGSDQIRLLTRFTEEGLKNRMAVVMGHYDEVLVSQLTPEVREGFYSCNTYFMSLDTQENRTYLEKLAALPSVHGIWPKGNGTLTNFGEGVCLCVRAFAKAAAKAGSFKTQALIEALKIAEVEGPQGTVHMDPVTQHASVNTYLARCNADGTFSVIENFGLCPPEIPKRYEPLFAALTKTPLKSATSTDETPTRQEKLSRFSQEDIAHRVLAVTDICIISADENGIILHANDSACRYFGYTRAEMIGATIDLLIPPRYREMHQEHFTRFLASPNMEIRMEQRGEILCYRSDGSEFPAEATISKFKDGDRWVLVATIMDITKRKKGEKDLLWRASHDQLTQLPNRSLIHERLTQALQRTATSGMQVGVLFIDLDKFKLVNDSYGHEAGDQLLCEVAKRLLQAVRPGDTVGRFAGDEFVVICDAIEDVETIEQIAHRIVHSVREPVSIIGSRQIFPTLSLGIACGRAPTHTADDLLSHSDNALYTAKESGRNKWVLFSKEIFETTRAHFNIANSLKEALMSDDFAVWYQPIYAADGKKMSGAEALVRSRSSEGWISPATFIPIAEETGTIIPLGLKIFEKVCRMQAKHKQFFDGGHIGYISYNLSSRQLADKNLLTQFGQIIKTEGAQPARIMLEVTETALMTNMEENIRTLQAFNELGFSFAIDDFGVGYSSFAQLLRLPIYCIKMDRIFVSNITEPRGKCVAAAIMQVAKQLGMKLVAEGVETAEQASLLVGLGCDQMQGFLYARPMPQESFEETLKNICPEP